MSFRTFLGLAPRPVSWKFPIPPGIVARPATLKISKRLATTAAKPGPTASLFQI
jgi:hypothetical protein